MNEFTVEDLISFIELSHTLSDDEKFTLKERVLDEMEGNGNKLSHGLAKKLEAVFEQDLAFVEREVLPEIVREVENADKAYQAELNAAQPDLRELVNEYERATHDLYEEYNMDFLALDREFDEIAQVEIGEKESAEISALHAKLKKK